MNPAEGEKRHSLFDTALECNKTFIFSAFRTTSDVRIFIWPHLKEQHPYLDIDLADQHPVNDRTFERREKFRMYANGDCDIMPSAQMPSIAGSVVYSMEGMSGFRLQHLESKFIFDGRHSFIGGKWLPHPILKSLNQIESWLQDPTTVRVDPYDLSRVLPDEPIKNSTTSPSSTT